MEYLYIDNPDMLCYFRYQQGRIDEKRDVLKEPRVHGRNASNALPVDDRMDNINTLEAMLSPIGLGSSKEEIRYTIRFP